MAASRREDGTRESDRVADVMRSRPKTRRLVVLDADGGKLLGLVCLNTAGTRFCKDQ